MTVLILKTCCSNLLEVSANTAHSGFQECRERKVLEYMQHLWRPKVLEVEGGVGPLRAVKHNGPDAIVLAETWALNADCLVEAGDFEVLRICV